MQLDQAGHPIAEQPAHGLGAVPAVAGVVAGDQDVADVVQQTCDLEFFVMGEVVAQQLRALAIVIEDVDGVAGAVRGVPGTGALVEEREQILDGVDPRGTHVLAPVFARRGVATVNVAQKP